MSEVASATLNITQMSEFLNVSREVLGRMCRDLCLVPKGNNRLKTFTGLERSRLVAYKEAEQEGRVNVTTGMMISDFNQMKFTRTLTKLGIQPQKVTKSASKWISVADLKLVIAEGNRNSHNQDSYDGVMETKEDFNNLLPRYSAEGAASELSISVAEIESIREDKVAGEIGYKLREEMPVMYSDHCLELIREYKNSLKNSQFERMENKQMSDAVHESLTDIFTNYMNPKFDSLKKRMTDLESLVEGKFEKADSAGSKTLKDLTASLDKLDDRVIELHALMTQVLEWATDPNNLMNLIEASGKGNQIANQILNTQLAPANELHYTQEELPIGEPWHSVDESATPLPHSESIEDFDSAYRKHGPDTLRFNNTLTHDECKKALDAYHAWVGRKLLPADPKDRGLRDLSNHIMKKIREHFKKRKSGMTLTELANEVKATQLNWKQSSQVQGWLKRSALGILSVSRDLEIVPVPSVNGGRPTTFLYHKDDWASIVKTGNSKSGS